MVRLNAAGSALDYATFLGGSDDDCGFALALDAAGRATVTGDTNSSDFPTTPGAFDPSYQRRRLRRLRGAAQRRRQRPRLRHLPRRELLMTRATPWRWTPPAAPL